MRLPFRPILDATQIIEPVLFLIAAGKLLTLGKEQRGGATSS